MDLSIQIKGKSHSQQGQKIINFYQSSFCFDVSFHCFTYPTQTHNTQRLSFYLPMFTIPFFSFVCFTRIRRASLIYNFYFYFVLTFLLSRCIFLYINEIYLHFTFTFTFSFNYFINYYYSSTYKITKTTKKGRKKIIKKIELAQTILTLLRKVWVFSMRDMG